MWGVCPTSDIGGMRCAFPPYACCSAGAQRAASTALGNSTGSPSLVILTMLCDLGIGQLNSDRLQRNERAFLVCAHQPRISRDIGHQDRCQPALDAISPGVRPLNAAVISP